MILLLREALFLIKWFNKILHITLYNTISARTKNHTYRCMFQFCIFKNIFSTYFWKSHKYCSCTVQGQGPRHWMEAPWHRASHLFRRLFPLPTQTGLEISGHRHLEGGVTPGTGQGSLGTGSTGAWGCWGSLPGVQGHWPRHTTGWAEQRARQGLLNVWLFPPQTKAMLRRQ